MYRSLKPRRHIPMSAPARHTPSFAIEPQAQCTPRRCCPAPRSVATRDLPRDDEARRLGSGWDVGWHRFAALRSHEHGTVMSRRAAPPGLPPRVWASTAGGSARRDGSRRNGGLPSSNLACVFAVLGFQECWISIVHNASPHAKTGHQGCFAKRAPSWQTAFSIAVSATLVARPPARCGPRQPSSKSKARQTFPLGSVRHSWFRLRGIDVFRDCLAWVRHRFEFVPYGFEVVLGLVRRCWEIRSNFNIPPPWFVSFASTLFGMMR